MLSICSSDPGHILNSRLIILCYENRWLSRRHFKPNSALPPKPAFLYQPRSSSSSGPKPWRGPDFSLSPTISNPSAKPMGFNFRVKSDLCPSLLPMAQSSSTSCLDGKVFKRDRPAPTCVVGTALILTYSLIFLLLFCGMQNCSGRERIFVLPLWHGSEILTCLADLQLEH